MLPGSTSTAKLWPKKAFIGLFLKGHFFHTFSKNEEIFIWKGHSLINISLFSQDHRGTVNTLPKQWLSLPLSPEKSICALTQMQPPPQSSTDPTSTRTYTDPTSTQTLRRDSWAPCLRMRPTVLHEESLCGFWVELHFGNSGDASVFQTRFLFLMAMWKKYCCMPSVNLDRAAPGSSHCNHPTRSQPAARPHPKIPQLPK